MKDDAERTAEFDDGDDGDGDGVLMSNATRARFKRCLSAGAAHGAAGGAAHGAAGGAAAAAAAPGYGGDGRRLKIAKR